jgi:hypothetical protein
MIGTKFRTLSSCFYHGIHARRKGDKAVLGMVGNDRGGAPFICRTVGEEVVGETVRRRWWWDASNHFVMEVEEWNG